MFRAVLIANRGEIACRVIRTLKRLGIRAIAVYSDADRDALHARLADEAHRIGPPPAAESYLRIEALLEVAARAGAEAVHPGYGFLAENAAFARACAEAGLAFIGPRPETIEAMGAKDRAKAAVADAGVPLVPGYHGAAQDDARLREAADETGYPVLVKAAAGGGGKGMRVVRQPVEFAAALEGARREARAAFGDERLILERWLERPRHVEVQVFGDRFGEVVHLFERDCSVQRRHQKVLEEAPAPGLAEAQRGALGEAAVRAARAVGYLGAGTVEFLLTPDGAFHFIEMNTRLQVEHPVTEMITGLDLVEWQLRIAAGEPLPLRQDEIGLRGHAIEARLYAEDPERGFLPSTGQLEHLRFPGEGPALRVETGVRACDVVSPFYDPLIAKLVAWGEDRAGALRRLGHALSEVDVVGPKSNLEFLERVCRSPEFAGGGVHTGFIEAAGDALLAPAGPPPRALLAQAALWLLAEQERAAAAAAARSGDPYSPWHRVDGWRLNDVGHQTLRLRADAGTFAIDARRTAEGFGLEIADASVAGRITPPAGGTAWAEIDGQGGPLRGHRSGRFLHLSSDLGRLRVEVVDPLHEAEPPDETAALLAAPMPGRIIRELVSEGQQVARGAPLLILEAMKMEHTIVAPGQGRIRALHFREGDQVEEGAVLLDLEAE